MNTQSLTINSLQAKFIRFIINLSQYTRNKLNVFLYNWYISPCKENYELVIILDVSFLRLSINGETYLMNGNLDSFLNDVFGERYDRFKVPYRYLNNKYLMTITIPI